MTTSTRKLKRRMRANRDAYDDLLALASEYATGWTRAQRGEFQRDLQEMDADYAALRRQYHQEVSIVLAATGLVDTGRG